MAESTANDGNIFDYLADSFYASLPEQTADDLAKCKRDALNWVKETVTRIVEEEIRWTEQHLENARRMRNEYRSSAQTPGTAEGPVV